MAVDLIIPHSYIVCKSFPGANGAADDCTIVLIEIQQKQLSWAIDQLTSCTIAGHSREFLCREASMDRLLELATSQHPGK